MIDSLIPATGPPLNYILIRDFIWARRPHHNKLVGQKWFLAYCNLRRPRIVPASDFIVIRPFLFCSHMRVSDFPAFFPSPSQQSVIPLQLFNPSSYCPSNSQIFFSLRVFVHILLSSGLVLVFECLVMVLEKFAPATQIINWYPRVSKFVAPASHNSATYPASAIPYLSVVQCDRLHHIIP
ncbi:hypothetical protein B0F90DRAFT_229208 [Multifurca ochricompacta]|uniref:Uncharacterized protein n=1 Tax=Multifurca ochricompacta TaxID=376703 RepID=A0AAD4QJV2_9AGAM|nr:hypothetical protein B0F90DRAFT_229208 [Multifurca ochricompacta]